MLLLGSANVYTTAPRQVCECYVHVSEWEELETWHKQVSSLQAQNSSSPEVFNAFNLKYDLNQIQ